MFSKTPRFRSSGSVSPDSRSKSSGTREASRPESLLEEDEISTGLNSVKRMMGNDSENGSKRSTSTERKTVADRKKPAQRGLKRSTSYIPRATSTRPKAPISVDARKTGRKSETSLKNKDDDSSKDKKSPKNDGNKSGMDSSILTAIASRETNDRKRPDSPKMPYGSKGSETSTPTKEPSSTKMTRSIPKPGHYSENSRKIDSKGKSSSSDEHPPSSPVNKSLEAQYEAKKTVYRLMIKEFEEKRKAITDHFKVLQDLRKKITATSGKEMFPEEMIKIGDVGPPFILDVPPQKKEEDEKSTIVTFESKMFDDVNIDFSEFQTSFESILGQQREIWLQLIQQFATSRRELIKKAIELNPEMDIGEIEKDENGLEHAIDNAKYHSKVKLDDMMIEMKKLFVNREKLRHELKVVMDSEKFSQMLTKEYKDLTNKLKELEEELAKEKIRTEDLMEKRALLEESNQEGTEKIQNLEEVVSSLKNQVLQLAYKCKALKQKELQANRAPSNMKPKDFKDLKAKSELLKALENHITELTNDYNSQKKKLQKRITELEDSLIEKEEALKTTTQAKATLEASLAEAEEKIRTVREKKKAFVEMVDKTKQILQTTNSNSSKREEQLWNELEGTKIVVKGYQEQLAKLQDEKNKLLLKFQTISEDKTNPNTERLAADLVRKDEIIKNLKDQVTDLQRACEEHSTKYNKLLVQIKEVHEKMEGKTDAAALTKQLGDMKLQRKELQEAIKELVTHNEELKSALAQRSLELDQRDRLVKQQCNLLKMRDELTELVKTKDDAQYQGVKKVMEQSSRWERKAEKIYKDLEKKANELDDMYKVLVDKQKQVEKLTKLVKVMEDQQDRAQEQRVRFESKIAELQRQLSDSKQKPIKTSLFSI